MTTYGEMRDESARLRLQSKVDRVTAEKLRAKEEMLDALELAVINGAHSYNADNGEPPNTVETSFSVKTAVGKYQLFAKLVHRPELAKGETGGHEVNDKLRTDRRSEEARVKKRPKGGGILGLVKARSSTRKNKGIG